MNGTVPVDTCVDTNEGKLEPDTITIIARENASASLLYLPPAFQRIYSAVHRMLTRRTPSETQVSSDRGGANIRDPRTTVVICKGVRLAGYQYDG